MNSSKNDPERVKILIVDDERANLLALHEVLDDPSYDVITADNPDQALSYLLKNEFALLLLDVFMEKMNGLDLARLVKSRPRSRLTPIIFLTAVRADKDFIASAYDAGAADFVEKPFEPEIVKAKVSIFVQLYRNRRQLERQKEILREIELREREAQVTEARVSGEKRFQDLVEGIDHGFVWSADPEKLTFSYISPRAEIILGHAIEKWKDHPNLWLEQVHPDDREAVMDVFRRAQMGKDLGLEHRFIRSDGETIWLRTGVRLARRGAGVGTELRGLSIDISYMKEIETALKDAVRVRDEFLSIASHELRTPLTPILLQLQLLERAVKKGDDKMVSPEKLLKVLDSWRKQIDRLGSLIEDMLDLTRIAAGKLSIAVEEADLSSMAREVVERHRTEATRVGSEIHLKGPETVRGSWDGRRIEQVLTNLLTNAIKYAPGKPIDVEIRDNGDTVAISVQDQGPGIPPGKQGKIFDRFERIDAPGSISGLGLGLYIVKSIVDAHGGSISVFSNIGEGARFEIVLPKQAKLKESVA